MMTELGAEVIGFGLIGLGPGFFGSVNRFSVNMPTPIPAKHPRFHRVMHDSFVRLVADGRLYAGLVWQALAEPMSLSSSSVLRHSCQVVHDIIDSAVSMHRTVLH